jgi:hypothetical protein
VRRHQRHAFATEALDAILVTRDAEVADDLLILLRRIDVLVVRFVEVGLT